MSYEAVWKGGATRDIDRLPLSIASAVIEFISGPLAHNPHRVGKPLRFALEGKHRARRGNDRVISMVRETAIRIEVIVLQHRADGYGWATGQSACDPAEVVDKMSPATRP